MASKVLTAEQWLAEEDFTLVLSSGFFGFFCHLGFWKALEERGLRPKKIAGCSAGALIASGIGSGVPADESKDILFSLKKEEFWDPGLGFGLLKGHKFDRKLREFTKPKFEDCDLELQFVVLDIFKWTTNTIKSGDLANGVRASCAVPGMFHPVKHDGTWYWDGGVFDKIALTNVNPKERVLCHFLYSPKEPFPEFKRGQWHWPKQMRRLVESNQPNWRGMLIGQIPRVGPNRLENGRLAYEMAYRKTTEWLGQPYEARISVL